MRRSRTLPLRISFVTPCRVWCPCYRLPQPRTGNATRLLHRLGLGSSRFARRYSGSHCCFLLLGVLRCFNSPGSLHRPYFIQTGVTPHDGCRVSPFGHPRIEAWSAAPRGFSQPPTSFIGIRRQGIHRWLFVAWRTKMLVLAMQVSKGRAGCSCNQGAPGERNREGPTAPASPPGGRVLRPVTGRRLPNSSWSTGSSHPKWMGSDSLERR